MSDVWAPHHSKPSIIDCSYQRNSRKAFEERSNLSVVRDVISPSIFLRTRRYQVCCCVPSHLPLLPTPSDQLDIQLSQAFAVVDPIVEIWYSCGLSHMTPGQVCAKLQVFGRVYDWGDRLCQMRERAIVNTSIWGVLHLYLVDLREYVSQALAVEILKSVK